MFDIAPTELLVIVVVAVLVIGPKDMPVALRAAGRWIGHIRRISGHFRSGLDAMIREAEMEEMEKKWREQNEKIMREHPADALPEAEPTGALPSRSTPVDAPSAASTAPAMAPVSAEAPAAVSAEAAAVAAAGVAVTGVSAEAALEPSKLTTTPAAVTAPASDGSLDSAKG